MPVLRQGPLANPDRRPLHVQVPRLNMSDLHFSRPVECLRCGGLHEELRCFKFIGVQPMVNGERMVYWALCPDLHEPLLFKDGHPITETQCTT